MSVWQKQRNWLNEVLWKPKKSLSIDQLKFQYQVLLKNPIVTESNRQLLVETFRSITELLIWGDQNDSRIFDFFLEKNMQSFFLKILTQKCGRYVSIQLLQTLNILFENIKNETSIYYLLSNNHINSIIVLKLDFSDEEILAYYISFLKTLSFHLNKHTIHFFYNEHLRDFPLYTEGIKFFKHSESMVRIAVRTLTLNVYKVDDKASLEYICSRTAVPYFSNLVWFIGNHVIELDECLIAQAHRLSRGRLEQLVAEHLDHLHYIADIFSLDVQCLNDILSDHFLNRLLIPLYVYSLTDKNMADTEENRPRISGMLSLFLLSQVFLILTHSSVIAPLAYLIFTGDTSLTLPTLLQQATLEASLSVQSSQSHAISVELSNGGSQSSPRRSRKRSSQSSSNMASSMTSIDGYVAVVDDQYVVIEASPSGSSSSVQSQEVSSTVSPLSSRSALPGLTSRSSSSVGAQAQSPASSAISPVKSSSNTTGDDGCQSAPTARRRLPLDDLPIQQCRHGIPVVHTLFLDSLMGALVINNDDTRCLFALSMLYAMLNNKGIHQKLLEAFSMRPKSTPQVRLVGWRHGRELAVGDKGKYSGGHTSPTYNSELVALLLSILDMCTATSNCIRLVTLRLAIMVLEDILDLRKVAVGPVDEGHTPVLQDHHVALVESIYESAILKLRLFYKGPQDEVFLEIFEQEYENEKSFKLNVPYLMMDEAMLLPPTDTPQSGIDFTRRLPSGEYEKTRKIMRVFFAIRTLSQKVTGEEENALPLTPPTNTYKVGDTLDMTPHDLVLCKVSCGEGELEEHFMVVTQLEFMLVDPHKTKLGHGVVHFIAFLQDLDISGDPADGKALFIIAYNKKSSQKRPALSGRFVFEDHIRCSAAKKFLHHSREKLFGSKMTRISKLLHLPVPDNLSSVPGLPGSHRILHQQHIMSFSDDGSLPVELGSTPTLAIATQPRITTEESDGGSADRFSLVPRPSPNNEITSSVLHRVFTTPQSGSKNSSASSQSIELSSFVPTSGDNLMAPPSLPPALPLGMPMSVLDQTSVRLTTPIPEDDRRGDGTGGGGGGKKVGGGKRLSLSPTPEPYFPDEEGLTASGGLLERQRLSSSERSREQSFERSLEMSMENDEQNRKGESEIVCPLGLELIAGNDEVLGGSSHDQVSTVEVGKTGDVDGCSLGRAESEAANVDDEKEPEEPVLGDNTKGTHPGTQSKVLVDQVCGLALSEITESNDNVAETIHSENLSSGPVNEQSLQEPDDLTVCTGNSEEGHSDQLQNLNVIISEQDRLVNGQKREATGHFVACDVKSAPELPQNPTQSVKGYSDSLTKERSNSETQFSSSVTKSSVNGVEISRKLSNSEGHICGSYDRRRERSSVEDDDYLNGDYLERRKTSEDDMEMFL